MIDVSRLRTASEQSFTYDLSDITLPASVSSQNLSLIGRDPNKIIVTLAQLARRTIEVKVSADIKAAEGYLADRATRITAKSSSRVPRTWSIRWTTRW